MDLSPDQTHLLVERGQAGEGTPAHSSASPPSPYEVYRCASRDCLGHCLIRYEQNLLRSLSESLGLVERPSDSVPTGIEVKPNRPLGISLEVPDNQLHCTQPAPRPAWWSHFAV
jgi:hypothetical protein